MTYQIFLLWFLSFFRQDWSSNMFPNLKEKFINLLSPSLVELSKEISDMAWILVFIKPKERNELIRKQCFEGFFRWINWDAFDNILKLICIVFFIKCWILTEQFFPKNEVFCHCFVFIKHFFLTSWSIFALGHELFKWLIFWFFCVIVVGFGSF